MSSVLTEIHLILTVIATICDLIERVTDFKHFCLIAAVCCLVYWYFRSTGETTHARQCPTTPERKRQLEEWLAQEEFIVIISRAMNQAAQNVARERSASVLDPLTPVHRQR